MFYFIRIPKHWLPRDCLFFFYIYRYGLLQRIESADPTLYCVIRQIATRRVMRSGAQHVVLESQQISFFLLFKFLKKKYLLICYRHAAAALVRVQFVGMVSWCWSRLGLELGAKQWCLAVPRLWSRVTNWVLYVLCSPTKGGNSAHDQAYKEPEIARDCIFFVSSEIVAPLLYFIQSSIVYALSFCLSYSLT